MSSQRPGSSENPQVSCLIPGSLIRVIDVYKIELHSALLIPFCGPAPAKPQGTIELLIALHPPCPFTFLLSPFQPEP